jgi:ferredoxin--NADP+ reductase
MKAPREPKINLFKKSAPLKAKVLKNIELTPEPGKGKRPKKEGIASIHRIVIGIDHSQFPFVIGQSAGIIPPGQDP